MESSAWPETGILKSILVQGIEESNFMPLLSRVNTSYQYCVENFLHKFPYKRMNRA